MLIRRRKPVPSGIARAPRREFPKHRQWVRGHACIVPDCESRRIECAHVRTGTDGGGSLKPSDWWTVPACGPTFDNGELIEGHHREQHRIGEASFEKKYGIDMKKTAMELARKSPDHLMRETMKEQKL